MRYIEFSIDGENQGSTHTIVAACRGVAPQNCNRCHCLYADYAFDCEIRLVREWTGEDIGTILARWF